MKNNSYAVFNLLPQWRAHEAARAAAAARIAAKQSGTAIRPNFADAAKTPAVCREDEAEY